MLAAMMRGVTLGTQHDLISASFTVPSGVTQVTVMSSGYSGNAGPNTVAAGPAGGGGGGAGAAIVGCKLNVSSGDTVSSAIVTGGGGSQQLQIKLNGTTVALINSGEDAGLFDSRGGNGGDASWLQGGSFNASGGSGASTNGAAGGNGTLVSVAGGYLVGGGGGGAGNLVSPPGAGGAGGSSGNGISGYPAVSYWGGAGAGAFNNGTTRLTTTTVSTAGSAFIYIYY